MGATSEFDLPYPDPADANDVPADLEELADAVEAILLARFTQNTDARLVNARPPNGAAGGALAGTYPGPSIANAALANTNPFAAAMLDGFAAVPTLRSLGPGAQQAAAGNHTHYGTPTFFAASPLNGDWTGSVQYMRRLGWGALALNVRKANFNVGDVVTTLPSGHRPLALARGAGDWEGAPRYWAVNPDGTVTVQGGSGSTGTGIAGFVVYPLA